MPLHTPHSDPTETMPNRVTGAAEAESRRPLGSETRSLTPGVDA